MRNRGNIKTRGFTADNFNYAVDTGTTNHYIINSLISGYVPGTYLVFKAANTNSGASDLKVGNLNTVAIKKNVSQNLDEGDILQGRIVSVVYDGTYFQMFTSVGATTPLDHAETHSIEGSDPITPSAIGAISLTGDETITGDKTFSGNLNLPLTTYASQNGIIYKDNVRFVHDFNYGNNGTVTTLGLNTFLGWGSGNFTMGSTASSIDHSSYNTGVGYQTLNAVTTGYKNTAIGYYSGKSITSGNLNTSLGSGTLTACTTGIKNIAIGDVALRDLTTGERNTAIGGMEYAQTTSDSTAVGVYSLNSHLSGVYNSAFGCSALRFLTSGNQDTAIGSHSLYSLTSGNNNIGIGFQAGRYYGSGTDALTTAYQSIYIGQTSKALVNGATNEIVIGDSAIGAGSNTITLGNTSITKTILRANVGIGTSTPTYKLTVSGDSSVGTLSFTGTGLNDASISGSFTGMINHTLRIKIDSIGNPDKFSWSVDGGTTWANTGVAITGSSQALNYTGISVTFGSITGHTVNDYWQASLTTYNGHIDMSGSLSASGVRLLGYDHGALNIGLGYGALQYAHATSRSNFGVGYLSLRNIMTGSNNVGIGPNSLVSITTGSNNICIGESSGGGMISASCNVSLGQCSMQYGTAENYNVSIGTRSFRNLTSGLFNTAIGDAAGCYISDGTTALTTITGGTYLGAQIRASNDSISNETVIGYQAIGTGSNTVVIGNTSVTQTTLKGKILTSGVPSGTTHTTSSLVVNPASATANADLLWLGVADTAKFQVDEDGDISTLGNVYLGKTTYASQNGIIYKNNIRFLHDFSYGNNGTVTPIGKNIFIGDSAGNFTIGSTATDSSQSSYNIGIGNSSLSSVTTGTQNTAVGPFSGNLITSGYFNSLFGYMSGYNLTSATANTSFGYYALRECITGSNNTAFGYKSLIGILGTGNVAFGYGSARAIGNWDDLTTADYGTFIGYNARPTSNGNTNEIAIGYDAIGTGSNTAVLGNASIIQTTLRGKILTSGVPSGTTHTTSSLVVNPASASEDGVLLWLGVADTAKFRVNENGYVYLSLTTNANREGVICKGTSRFIHDFNYGNNGTITTDGVNTFIGENAGNFSMGSTATLTYHSSYNTLVGSYSGNSLTTGSHNSTLGTYALQHVTKGRKNVAIGMNSVRNLTTSEEVVAIGFGSATNMVSGVGGTYIGSNSGYYINNTATPWTDYNVALGFSTLYGSTTPADNIGNYNTAIGREVLESRTSGGYNVGLGALSLTDLTTGNYNVALGYNSGRYISDGSTPLVSPLNSIFIGSNTKANSLTSSNEIVIGDSAIGAGSNTVTLGNTSITKTILRENVGIGTSTPTYKLTVAGSSVIGTLTFTGSGLNDAILSGTYTGFFNQTLRIKIDAVGAPDTFSWSIDGGTTWAQAGVPITGSAQALNYTGVLVTFGVTTGHTLNDYWQTTLIPNNSHILCSGKLMFENQYRCLSLDANSNIMLGGYVFGAGKYVGRYNIAIGHRPMNNATSASFNVAVGYQPLNCITTGTSNFGVLNDAGYNITEGYGNVAIGATALYSSTTAVDSIAIGREALQYSISSGNIGIGHRALRNITGAGDGNVSVGLHSIEDATYAIYSVSLGHFAGRYIYDGVSTLTTANRSVYIGAYTKALTNSSENEIVIGYNTIGSGNNTVTLGNTSITSSILRGKILTSGIPSGTTHTTSSLVVNPASATADADLLWLGVADTAKFQVDEDGDISTLGNVYLGQTTYASQNGIIYKGSNKFLHNFSYGDNGTVTPVGRNIFLGESSGNLTMGSTATNTEHSSHNIAIGYSVMTNATLANYNIAIGDASLNSITEGVGNVGIGVAACGAVTTAENNIGIGYFALKKTTTSSYNVAIGRYALAEATSAGNTALGTATLQALTTGATNVAVGHNSGYSLNTSSFNVSVGNLSLMYATNSSKSNLALGYNSGRLIADGSTSLTTVNYGVFIGSDSKALADSSSNEIVIGYNAIGFGSNTVTLGNTSITSSVLRGKILTSGVPSGTTHTTSSLVVNPASATADADLLWLGVADNAKFQVDEDGDVKCAGKLEINGASLGAILAIKNDGLAALGWHITGQAIGYLSYSGTDACFRAVNGMRIEVNANQPAISIDSGANITFGVDSGDTITCTGRLLVRTLASNPTDATPGNRPAGSVYEISHYNENLYLCTNASTPLWKKITAVSDATIGPSSYAQNAVVLINEHQGKTNSALVLTPLGTGSFILGPPPDGDVTGGNARGTRSIDLQIQRNTNTQVATGTDSFASGKANAASGNHSRSEGYVCVASGTHSHALGWGSQASSFCGYAYGYYARANLYGQYSHCSGIFGQGAGDAQRHNLIFRREIATTDATELFLDGTDDRAILSADRTWACTIKIVARQDNGKSGSGIYFALIERTSTTTRLIGTVQTILAWSAETEIGSPTISISADDTNEALVIVITQANNTSTRWLATVDTSEVGY